MTSQKRAVVDIVTSSDESEVGSVESYESLESSGDENENAHNSTVDLVKSEASDSDDADDATMDVVELKNDEKMDVEKKEELERAPLPDDNEWQQRQALKRKSNRQEPGMPSRAVRGLRQTANEVRENMSRVKPDVVADRERERRLTRLATAGVVQLFNAVAARQSSTEATLAAVTSKSEFKRERVKERIRVEGDAHFESSLGRAGDDKKAKNGGGSSWLSDNVGDALIVKEDD